MTRLAIQTVAVALGVAVASASVVVRQEECRAAGVRCAGAPGQPFVPYDMCCDGLDCKGAGTEYGLFCVDVENPGDFTVSDDPVPATDAPDGVATAGDEETTTTTAVPETVTTVAEVEEEEETTTGETTVEASSDVADETTATTGTAAEASSEEDDSTTVGGVAVPGDDADDTSATATSEDDEDDTLTGTSASATDEDEDDDAIFGKDDADASDESEDDDGDSVCFPAAATVELENGQTVAMDSLSIGDVVKVGVNEYSRVFMFTHKMAGVAHKFVTLETESGASLSLTEGHYLYANGALVAAKTVNVGDVLTLGNGESSAVVAVGSTSSTGLFNPQTVNGNVVVDGVLASTYTTAVEPTFAHAVLAPFRMLNNFGLQFTALESGGGIFAGVAPRGQAAF